MPNPKVLAEKQAIVDALADKLANTSGGVFVDYSGTTVAADTQMRRAMRAANVEYAVVKNTLTRFAANKTGFDALDPFLNGPTAYAFSCDDPVAAARVICEFANKKDSALSIKAGIVDGKIISEAEVKALAELPPKDVLLAQVLGTMIAPISSFATVLNATIRGLAIVLNAIAEKKDSPA